MVSLIALLSVIFVADSANKHRQDQLGRMKQYSLLTINPEMVDEDSRVLEFVAFDQHYVVELTRKREWTPSSVRHSNVDEEVHSRLSSMKESCHFSGRVLNEAADSVVSASLCEGRGLRARISAFGETLILKPSAYYLDVEADKVGNHSVNGEVLAFRLSDFEKPEIMVTDESKAPSDSSFDAVFEAADEETDEGLRRRLYSSANPAQTEIAVVIGPVRTNNYRDNYGANWYRELYQDTVDIMNAVDEIYANTNWNVDGRSSVGGYNALRIVLSEIYVIYSFTGIHRGMAPTKRFPDDCLQHGKAADEYDDSNECAIVGNHWLGLIQNWILNNMDTSNYDNVQFISDIMFNWGKCKYSDRACSRTLGWGSVGTVCRGSRSSAVSSVVYDWAGNDGVVGTIAHELGHNFGLRHDGQPGPAESCCANCGLMGYGNNDDTFSTCSLDLMEEYYNGRGNHLQCLGVGWTGAVATNVDSGEQGVPQPSPTAAPVEAPSVPPTPSGSEMSGCLRVVHLGANYDGTWLEIAGGSNAHAAYEFTNAQGATKYLYYKRLTWSTNFVSKWTISETLDSGDYVNMICTQEYLYECSGNWKYPGGGNGWGIIPDSVTDYHCDPDDVIDYSCDGSFDRICVAGSGDNGQYDGYYSASGCFEGQRYYEGASGNALTYGLYLCFDEQSSSIGRWTISGSLCDRGNIVSKTATPQENVLAPTYWLHKGASSTTYSFDNDMTVYDCSPGNNGALSGDDLKCLEEKAYGDEICVSTNNSLWSGQGHRTFKLYEELCSNEEPIYHFIQYNDSKSLHLPSGEILSAEVESTLYLHFELVYPTVTDNETVGQWWLSRDEMTEHNRIAFCEQEDLRECTSNQWNVEVTSHGEDGGDGLDGTIFNVLDDFSSVLDGNCNSHFSELSGSPDVDDSNLSPEVITGIVAVVLLCVAMVFVAGLCAWRRLKYQQYHNDSRKVRQSVLSNDEVHAVKEAQDGDETAEISIDVEAVRL